jgi:hypothetical protein
MTTYKVSSHPFVHTDGRPANLKAIAVFSDATKLGTPQAVRIIQNGEPFQCAKPKIRLLRDLGFKVVPVRPMPDTSGCNRYHITGHTFRMADGRSDGLRALDVLRDVTRMTLVDAVGALIPGTATQLTASHAATLRRKGFKLKTIKE